MNCAAKTNNKEPIMYFICELGKVIQYCRRAALAPRALLNFSEIGIPHNRYKYITHVRLHLD